MSKTLQPVSGGSRPLAPKTSRSARGSTNLDDDLKKADLALKRVQVKSEKWKIWIQLGGLIAILISSGLCWSFQQAQREGRQAEFEEFRAALGNLTVDSPVGRAAGYHALRSYLISSSEPDLSDASLYALLHTLSVEQEGSLRTVALNVLNMQLIHELPNETRKSAIDLTIELLRRLSSEIEIAESADESVRSLEARRKDLIIILGRLLSRWRADALNLVAINLEGLTVMDAELARTDFSRSNLINAKFERCTLSGARFAQSVIASSFLSCNLTGAEFSPKVFKPSTFKGSDLTDAKLRYYSFIELNYYGLPGWAGLGSFKDAKLSNTLFSNPSIFITLPKDVSNLNSLSALPSTLISNRTPEDFVAGLTFGVDEAKGSSGSCVGVSVGS